MKLNLSFKVALFATTAIVAFCSTVAAPAYEVSCPLARILKDGSCFVDEQAFAAQLSKHLEVAPRLIAVAVSSSVDFQEKAKPQNQPASSPYSLEYGRVLKSAHKGGLIIHWQYSGPGKAEGYAAFENGQLVAALMTQIQ